MSKPSERAVKAYENFVQAFVKHGMQTESSTGADLLHEMRFSGKQAQSTFGEWYEEVSRDAMQRAVTALRDMRILRPDHRQAMNAELVQQLEGAVDIHRKWHELIAVAGSIKNIPKLVRRVEKTLRNQAA